MSLYFTKLFASITDSSIWSEDSDTKVVWVTMLAMADAQGYIAAAVPGLAKRAGVPIDKTELALQKFLSVDPYSRSEEFEGRRIGKVEGGWILLNYEKYRKIQHAEERKEQNRVNQAKFRANSKQIVSNSNQKSALSAQVEEEVEEEVDKKSICRAEEVLSYLNEKTGKKFQSVNGSLKFIEGRLNEGATIDQCKAVIDLKCIAWLRDSKMKDYLRPQTLFNAEKFAAYIGEIGSQQPKQNLKDEWNNFKGKI